MTSRARRWFGALAVCGAVTGVATGGLVVSQPAGAAQPGWTVLVYVAADNNLESFAMPNLQQLAGVGSGPGLDIEVFVDRSPAYSNAPWATSVTSPARKCCRSTRAPSPR